MVCWTVSAKRQQGFVKEFSCRVKQVDDPLTIWARYSARLGQHTALSIAPTLRIATKPLNLFKNLHGEMTCQGIRPKQQLPKLRRQSTGRCGFEAFLRFGGKPKLAEAIRTMQRNVIINSARTSQSVHHCSLMPFSPPNLHHVCLPLALRSELCCRRSTPASATSAMSCKLRAKAPSSSGIMHVKCLLQL